MSHPASPRSRRIGTVGKIALVALTAFVPITLSACSPGAEPEEDSTLVVAEIASGAVNFDPTATLSILDWHPQLVYDFIIKPDDEIREDREGGPRSYEPGLATEWEFSDDGLTFTMQIREGISYSDGEPVTAETVKAGLDYALTYEKSGSTLKSRHITAVEVTGGFEVTIRLSESPIPDKDWFIAIIGESGLAAPSAMADPEKLVTTPVGSGPYTLDLEASQEGLEYVYHKRDDYWDADEYAYDTIVVKRFEDNVAALNALQSGQVDATMLDATTVAGAKAAGFEVFEGAGRWQALILGDRQGSGPSGDLRVRQAISMAFDRDAIVENVLQGYGRASNQVYAPGMPEYQDDRADDYAYDPEGARELLAEAGYPDGFELVLPRVVELGNPYEPVIEQSLADIGITVTWEVVPITEFGAAIFTEPKYPIVWLYQDFVSATAAFVALPPDGFNNPNYPYQDPEFDALFEDLRYGSPDEVIAAKDAIGNYVLDNAFFAVLGQPFVLAAAKDGIEIGMRGVTGQAPFIQDFRPVD